MRSAEYVANELNQYTQIDTTTSASPCETFNPEFDDDGNQTLIRTATGTWRVTYNGENRPGLWTCLAACDTVATNGETIAMSYDRLGRRVTKNDERFVYDGYLQIANIHSTATNSNCFTWDPTEPIATRPLVWRSSALCTPNSALYYTHDGNKNVSEVVATNCDLAVHYGYAPFGAVALFRGEYALVNPWRFSSEYVDDETCCDYFNSRHFEPIQGRWLSKDHIEERGGINLYEFIGNMPLLGFDKLGENRYITQFDILGIGKSGGTQLHVGVAVDDWKCVNGQWAKIGVITFNFGAKNDFLHRALASLWVLQGEIVESKGLNLQAPITLKSSPCQDIKMAALIREEAKNPPFYNVLFHQCVFWSVGAVNYGM